MNGILQDIQMLLSLAPLGFVWNNCCCGASVADIWAASGSDTTPAYMDNLSGYSSADDVWIGGTAVPTPLRGLAAGASLDMYGYSIGGLNPPVTLLQDNDQYDMSGNSWSSKTSISSPARQNAGSVGFDGNVYVYGGGPPSGTFALDLTDAYNVAGDSWSSKSTMPSPQRKSHAYLSIVDGANTFLYAMGGSTLTGIIRDNDEYDPSGDSWSSATNIPIPARYSIYGGGTISGLGYIFGGLSNLGAYLKDLDEYDPGAGSWSSKTDGTITRAKNCVRVSSLDLLHTFCGIQSGAPIIYTAVHESYDPLSDSWTSNEALPNPPRVDSNNFSTVSG